MYILKYLKLTEKLYIHCKTHFKNYFICKHVTCHSPMWWSEGQLAGADLFPPLGDPGIELKLSGLCGKSFDVLSHLASPRPFLVNVRDSSGCAYNFPCRKLIPVIHCFFSFGHPSHVPICHSPFFFLDAFFALLGFPLYQVTPLMWTPQSSPCWKVYAKRSFQNVLTVLWPK